MLRCSFKHKYTESKCEKYTFAHANSDRGLKQLDPKHIQDVPHVTDDCRKDSWTPSASTTLDRLKTELLQNRPSAKCFSQH